MPRQPLAPYDYRPPPELRGRARSGAPVAIVGAGPIGLAAAIDLALHGVASVVLDRRDRPSEGSRAICWARRSLEILDRLGIGERMVEKGVTWRVGRVFDGADEVYSFDFSPETGHKMPAFVNLQQTYVERYLVERAREFPGLIDLRFCNRVVGHADHGDRITLRIETPDGAYALDALYLLTCDGARSETRQRMGLDFAGHRFEDRFLIADVEMRADFPPERRFWFNPAFHPGQTALLHKQPDDIWRIDLQLGPDADPEAERRPERVIPRIAAAVDGPRFELDWVSVYTFRCARLARFVHGRVIFAGDSAHVVSPFGARGGNGGIHDVDNLAWKLARVLGGAAPESLLLSYDEERGRGADENIRASTESTRFISPEGAAARLFRDEILALARRHPFARRLINSGRLSVPCSLAGCALQTAGPAAPGPVPGDACPDAPLDGGWLLERLGGAFGLIASGVDPPAVAGLETLRLAGGVAAERYPAGVYLIRPDQHVAARWPGSDAAAIEAALRRAGGECR